MFEGDTFACPHKSIKILKINCKLQRLSCKGMYQLVFVFTWLVNYLFPFHL
ncbi:hypothetical protein Lalb_Chr09g0323721 [Lupinus albus]|uniref:Uncharacterized protein n=1 Tax=Lupinus albus TaxID=3870 RepID=A0A6A4PZ75_LUPAL|nr:hypothetical protein Lalb_Chr09g0323721 [Lupinus albus]